QAAAVFVECTRSSVGDERSTLFDKRADLADLGGGKRARSWQSQHAITPLQQLALFNLPVRYEVVLQSCILDQPAVRFAQTEYVVVLPLVRTRPAHGPGFTLGFLRQHPF